MPITDRREKELADQGFIPLVHCKGTDYAAFFSVQSAQKAKLYDKEAANANARLSTQLPYIFAVSRFAHYLKAMMRDKLGSFMSRTDCERWLNQWIQHYVTPDDTASQAVKAQSSFARCEDRSVRSPGQAGRISCDGVPASALPAGRIVGVICAWWRSCRRSARKVKKVVIQVCRIWRE